MLLNVGAPKLLIQIAFLPFLPLLHQSDIARENPASIKIQSCQNTSKATNIEATGSDVNLYWNYSFL